MNSCISVIISFYNSSEFLENCIDSVLNQTINELSLSEYENNLQIILIDNGSTDNSGEIAKNYAKNYENVEYYHINHRGFNYGLNYGVDICDGDYISFLNSEDMISPYAYERMFNLVTKNDSDLATGFVCEFDNGKCINPNQYGPAFFGDEVTTLKDNPDILYDSLLFNKLIRHSFFTDNDFKFSESVSSVDESIVLQMQNLANSISIINEPCYYSRIPLIKDFTTSIDDKLSVMRLTDKYIKDNVANLEDKKQIKWLKVDLMKYIDNQKTYQKKSHNIHLIF
ncbi:glycosyltransferase [Methanobrevibacter sp.]|uniref:glycosyltransferase n=1 Tax=Methanobrevibacter sp. TaxID=66852 RepID=UPI00389033EA